MNKLLAICAGAILLLDCDRDIRTGVAGDPGTNPPADAAADTTTPEAPDATGDAASDSSAPSPDAADGDAASVTFFPTMFVSIDGVFKGFRLSALHPQSTNPDLIRLEFTTGLRTLGSEATPGEIYSEVWLLITTAGAPVSGTYDCTPASGAPGGVPSVALVWSYNHILPNSGRSDFASSGGPCTATFSDFGMDAGARIRGTFSGTLDRGHTLSGGTFDLVVPSQIPVTGQ